MFYLERMEKLSEMNTLKLEKLRYLSSYIDQIRVSRVLLQIGNASFLNKAAGVYIFHFAKI